MEYAEWEELTARASTFVFTLPSPTSVGAARTGDTTRAKARIALVSCILFDAFGVKNEIF